MRRRALLMGGQKGESAFIPVLNNIEFNLLISTKNGDMVANWGDGTINDIGNLRNYDYTTSATTPLTLTFTKKIYETAYSGDIEVVFKKGLKDVYSIAIWKFLKGNTTADETTDKYNILDLSNFLSQFTNLYSFNLNSYGYGSAPKMASVYGDLSDLPFWIKKVRIMTCNVIGAPHTLYLDLDKYPSNSSLEFFHHESTASSGANSTLKIIGDLSNIPQSISFFKIVTLSTVASSISYTAGRDWRSDFDTLYLNRVMTETENDNILIDLADSVTSAIGDKVIYLRGARTSASDSAVSYLGGLGFTVTITP